MANIATATVQLEIDQSKTRSELDKVKTNLDTQLRTLHRGLREAIQPIEQVFNRITAIGAGLGFKAIHSFLKSNSDAAIDFREKLDELDTAFGKLGEKVLKLSIGGKTTTEWVDVFINKLNSLSGKELQAILDKWLKIAAVIASLKTIEFTIKGLKGLEELSKFVGPLQQTSNIGNLASNAALTGLATSYGLRKPLRNIYIEQPGFKDKIPPRLEEYKKTADALIDKFNTPATLKTIVNENIGKSNLTVESFRKKIETYLDSKSKDLNKAVNGSIENIAKSLNTSFANISKNIIGTLGKLSIAGSFAFLAYEIGSLVSDLIAKGINSITGTPNKGIGVTLNQQAVQIYENSLSNIRRTLLSSFNKTAELMSTSIETAGFLFKEKIENYSKFKGFNLNRTGPELRKDILAGQDLVKSSQMIATVASFRKLEALGNIELLKKRAEEKGLDYKQGETAKSIKHFQDLADASAKLEEEAKNGIEKGRASISAAFDAIINLSDQEKEYAKKRNVIQLQLKDFLLNKFKAQYPTKNDVPERILRRTNAGEVYNVDLYGRKTDFPTVTRNDLLKRQIALAEERRIFYAKLYGGTSYEPNSKLMQQAAKAQQQTAELVTITDKGKKYTTTAELKQAFIDAMQELITLTKEQTDLQDKQFNTENKVNKILENWNLAPVEVY